jgi:hypothetical protein
MSSTNERTKGMWLVGLLALPMVCAAGSQPQSPAQNEKLEWLLATHDVRLVMQTTRQKQDCLEHEAEHSR